MAKRPRFSEPTTSRRAKAACGIFLLAVTWAVFGQTISHQFVNYDDQTYVYGNPVVSQGLTLSGLAAAFTHTVSHNWQPLTVISHMLDCQFYGLHPGGHHFTSILLHGIAAVLLFLLLCDLTGAAGPSLLAAALFVVHPLRAESVAWIAERKDVLSGLLFMLTLGAYVRYVRKPSASRYLVIVLTFALGLMSKPMLVTVPFVLLLLDYWPLRRFESSAGTWKKDTGLTHLLREKVPLFALSLVSVSLTLFTQRGATRSVEEIPITLRTGNAVVSLVAYLRDMIWPARLAAFYPFPRNGPPVWELILCLCLVVTITVVMISAGRERRYLITGWLWYLVMLAPVIGIVQVGLQARADRYTYLPQIGLYFALAFLAADLAKSRKLRRLTAGGAFILIILLAWRARAEVSGWRDSESLWTHAIKSTSENDVAESGLADALLARGKIDEAIVHARKAAGYRPNSVEALNNLGVAYSRKGQFEEAIAQLEKVIPLDPARPNVHYNLATALLQSGRTDEAISHFEKELELQPQYAQARNDLGIALSQKGDLGEGIAQWQQTLEIQPNNLDAQCNLAWVLATCDDPLLRNGVESVRLAQRAVQLSQGRNPRVLRLLAVGYAETGRFPEAIDAAERALQVATEQGNAGLAATLRHNIEQFQAQMPLRDSTPSR